MDFASEIVVSKFRPVVWAVLVALTGKCRLNIVWGLSWESHKKGGNKMAGLNFKTEPVLDHGNFSPGV